MNELKKTKKESLGCLFWCSFLLFLKDLIMLARIFLFALLALVCVYHAECAAIGPGLTHDPDAYIADLGGELSPPILTNIGTHLDSSQGIWTESSPYLAGQHGAEGFRDPNVDPQ
ncbi:MAG: hypothetical protein Q8M35_10760 [Pseudohongiella sp.]|nr:hypothetical protein [Pseudohongiella sp.]